MPGQRTLQYAYIVERILQKREEIAVIGCYHLLNYEEANQVSVKLVPSDDSVDGSARVVPAELTIVSRTTLAPNEPMVPDVPEIVA